MGRPETSRQFAQYISKSIGLRDCAMMLTKSGSRERHLFLPLRAAPPLSSGKHTLAVLYIVSISDWIALISLVVVIKNPNKITFKESISVNVSLR